AIHKNARRTELADQPVVEPFVKIRLNDVAGERADLVGGVVNIFDLVAEEEGAGVNQPGGRSCKVREDAGVVRRPTVEFPAQSKVEGQLPCNLEVVLNEG